MNCKFCQTEMERQDTVKIIIKRGIILLIPAADYECPNCQATFFWVKGRKLLVTGKPLVFDLADLFEKEEDLFRHPTFPNFELG